MDTGTRNLPAVGLPTRRRLRVYAFDPMSTRLSGRGLEIDVRYEPVAPGPVGDLLTVADFDGARQVWYRPVDLDDPAILARGGLWPSESDPRTHQQVVYAVAMSVIERFERFLGRRFRWQGKQSLVLIPHAFEGRNAFFDPERRAVLFGYYRADLRAPGANLPGQLMFTCLSVDVVAHEVTHALVHRLRPSYSVATNADVLAWHEAFADLVALFHHFAFPEVVSEAVASSSGDLHDAQGLLDLALEFGESTGRGGALRSAIGSPPDPAAFRDLLEPHARGAQFVAAVFDAYLMAYQASIADLLRIATGGTGVLPPGHLHPDLVARVTYEAVKNADRLLGMVVRAFDYLPVVDVTFGDVVRAIVTADRGLYPDDESHLRARLVEALRRRGIFPVGIMSLADDALVWPDADGLELQCDPDAPVDLSGVIQSATQDLDPFSDPGSIESDEENDVRSGYSEPKGSAGDESAIGKAAPALVAWAGVHAVELGFDPSTPIQLSGLHVVFRQAADGQPRPGIVVQFRQRRRDLEDQSVDEHERIPVHAGTTVIARVDGKIERLVPKPLPFADPTVIDRITDPSHADAARATHAEGTARLGAMRSWNAAVEATDALAAWSPAPAMSRLTFANLHAGAR